MKKNKMSSILAMFMALLMLASAFPVSAFTSQNGTGITSRYTAIANGCLTQSEANTVDNKLDEIYAKLNLDDLDLFHQYLAVYNYVTTNMHYDKDDSYGTKCGSYYNEFILNKGVCGNFSSMFYRICNSAKEYSGYTKSKVNDLSNNVDCVGGFYYRRDGALYGHEWNIVKFEDYWYIVDTSDYDFMVAYGNDGGSFFNIDHLDAENETAAYKAAHPMAKADLDTKKYGMTKTFLGYNYPNFNLSVSYDCTKGVVVTWQDAPLKNGNMPIAYELGDYTTTKDTGKKCGNFPLNYAYVHSADDTEDRKYQYTSTYEAKDGVYTMYIKNADFTDEILDFMNNNNGSEYGFWLQAWDSDHNYCYSDYVCQNIFYQPKGYHTKGDLVNSKAATCTSTGYKQYACKDCDALITETTAKVPHTYDSGKTIKEPTCTEKGTKSYTCTVCGSSKTEDISPLGHNYVAKVTKDATCTTGGVITYTCSRCDSSYVEYTNALGHNYSTSKVVKEPTCTEKGISTYYCSRCDSTETKDVNALGHKWDNGVKQEDGSILYTCERDDCGFTRTQELSNGSYKISSAINENKSIKIATDNSSNGAKLLIDNKVNSQKGDFKVSYNIDLDLYTITVDYSNKVLDVPGAANKNGTKIQQYTSNNSNAQKWYLKDAGNGYFYIVSKCNGLYLDIPGGKLENGKEVQLYTGNGSKAQKFKFEKIEEPSCEQIVDDGTYKISSAINTNRAFRINNGVNSNKTKITIGNKNSAVFEDFEFIYNKNNKSYTIINKATGKALDVPGASRSLKTQIQQYDSNGSQAQQWVLEDAGDGYYYIVSKSSGLCLDIPGANPKNGATIQCYALNYSNAQKFKLEQTDSLESQQIIDDGTYTICSKTNGNKVLDVAGGSTANKANIQLYKSNGSLAQKFKFKYDDKTKSYSIINAKSGKALDVSGASFANKANIWQYDANNSLAQRWIIIQNYDNSYSIISQCNGLSIDLNGGRIDDKTNIQCYEPNGSNAQKFNII